MVKILLMRARKNIILHKIIPWWAKLGIKLILSRLKISYKFWRKIGLFRHGSIDVAEYGFRIFEERARQAGVWGGLNGKIILELGPGDSISSAIIAGSMGARSILVDVGSYANYESLIYQKLTNNLQAEGLQPRNIKYCKSLNEILAINGSDYMIEGLKSLQSIPNKSVDYIFSQAVLEHIKKNEFLPVLKELKRVLKDGGVCSHQIDLRDHLGGALNNRRFSDAIWESQFFSTSGFYTNRISYSQMIELFKDAGFLFRDVVKKKWEHMPTPRKKMASDFDILSDSDLLA